MVVFLGETCHVYFGVLWQNRIIFFHLIIWHILNFSGFVVYVPHLIFVPSCKPQLAQRWCSGISIWNLKNWMFRLKHKCCYLHHPPLWFFNKGCSSCDKTLSIYFSFHGNFNCICWQSLLSWLLSPTFQVFS
jgi:hypothetical protein